MVPTFARTTELLVFLLFPFFVRYRSDYPASKDFAVSWEHSGVVLAMRKVQDCGGIIELEDWLADTYREDTSEVC
jgi:hypothetical protein